MQKVEFGIGFLIFMICFSFVINSLLSSPHKEPELMEGTMLLETLLKSKGVPENWESGNVEKIGLASAPNVLDREKVEELMKMDYKDAKDILGIKGDFRVILESESCKFTYGKAIPQEKSVKKFERPVVIDNELGKFYLYYW
ncbi:MAG: hypothetical protein U9N35_03680 [Euryarchaeota archaeon]|nr:hypothetical protein [Euryarchaeota archaeon]